MGIEIQRVRYIFGQLEKGTRSTLIMDHLDRWKEQDEASGRRGLESEKRVREVLAAIPEVSEVVCSESWSKPDIEGIDYIAVVYGKRIRVQVKSSSRGVKEFRCELCRRYNVPPDEIDLFMKREGWFVINGQLPKETIMSIFRKTFCNQ